MLVTSDQAEGTEQRSRKIGISKCQLWNSAPQLPFLTLFSQREQLGLPCPTWRESWTFPEKTPQAIGIWWFLRESGSSTPCIHLQAISHLPKFQPAQ